MHDAAGLRQRVRSQEIGFSGFLSNERTNFGALMVEVSSGLAKASLHALEGGKYSRPTTSDRQCFRVVVAPFQGAFNLLRDLPEVSLRSTSGYNL